MGIVGLPVAQLRYVKYVGSVVAKGLGVLHNGPSSDQISNKYYVIACDLQSEDTLCSAVRYHVRQDADLIWLESAKRCTSR